MTFALTETGGTFAWYSAGNIIPYRKTNVDTVYVDYSADWITSIQTGTTGATVWVTSNRTGSQRSTTIRFSIDGETFPYIYQATQNYDETSVSAFTITSGDDITIGASGGTWSIGYETTLTGITYEFMQGSNTLLASGSTSSSPLALTVQPNEYASSKTYVARFYSGGNAVGIASLFQLPAEESGGTDYSEQYLTLERVQYGSSPDNGISMGLNLKVNSLKPTTSVNETWNGDSGVTFEFSIDDGDTWYTANESLSNAMSVVGDRIMLRASASTLTYDSIRLYVYKNGGYDMFKVYGNPLSLIYGSDFNQSHANETIVLRRLFRQNTLLRSAEGLAIPYHTGATYNLREMFQGDYYMLYSPESIPDCDTNAAQMFYNCSALTTAPVVNIYNYANSDFSQMFYHCSALNEVTFRCVLPNTGGNQSKYINIFKNAGSGVFKKNPDASVYVEEYSGSGTWLRNGATSDTFSHIPTNWTVEDYTSGSTPDTGTTPGGSSLQSTQVRYKTSDNGQLISWSATTSDGIYVNVVSNVQQGDNSWIVTFDSAITNFYRTAAYYSSYLTYLELPDSVTWISAGAVSGNTYITELVAYGLERLPSRLTSGSTAFTSVTVGMAMTYVDTNAIVNPVRQSGAYYTDKTVELHYPGTMSEWNANVSYAFTPSSTIAAGKNYVKIICSDGTMVRCWG